MYIFADGIELYAVARLDNANIIVVNLDALVMLWALWSTLFSDLRHVGNLKRTGVVSIA